LRIKNNEINREYDLKRTELEKLIALENRKNFLDEQVKSREKLLANIEASISEKSDEKTNIENDLSSIKKDLQIFSPQLDLINLGYFEEPIYLFNTSDRFKEEIKIIREKQKDLIKENKAVIIPSSIAVIQSDSLAQKALQGQISLMLKAFNIECDNLIDKLNPANFPNILERIDKVATDIEKLSLSLKCGFTKEYIQLKFEECEYVYQYNLKRQREQEEQDRIKEMMREEEKARKDFERTIAKTEKEERLYNDAIEEARKQFELANDDEKKKLEQKLEFLQQQLQEAQERNQRAKSMAEQTRRGHVYIISNIGSFGENVYKIGLTRRLEPLDRVKELGDASVPFTFDVHALIYSEDAPALENQLHKTFNSARLNQINLRKEFFNVDLNDIKNEVEKIYGDQVEFKMTALAEQYYESLSLRGLIQAE